MDKLSVAKAKELRGEIIKNLYVCYDHPILISNIHNLLRYKNYNSKDDIKKAFQYLAGIKKEFIQITINEDNYMTSLVQLTPMGINLAEGDITDMGVILYG